MKAQLMRKARKLGLGIYQKDDGYMLCDLRTNAVVAGGSPIPFCLTIEELEAEIEDRIERSQS